MDQNKKFFATGLLILTILIVIFLASAITDVKFQPGSNFAQESDERELVPIKLPDLYTPIWYYLLMCTIWVVLPVSVIIFIKYPDVRKKTLQGLVYVALYGFILFLLSRKTQEDSPEVAEIEQELIESNVIATQREAAEFLSSVAEADHNLNIIFDITLVLLIGILVWIIYRKFFHKPSSPTEQLKSEIVGVINDIESGADLNNAIIRCYADMSKILFDRRGIERKHAMTPREFESELQEIGLPQTAVKRLTRLFEDVRYGNTGFDLYSEQEAISCLKAIAEVC